MRFVKSPQRVRGQMVAHLADGITSQCRSKAERPASLADFAQETPEGFRPWGIGGDGVGPEGWELVGGDALQRHTCRRCWPRFGRLLAAGVPLEES